MEILKETTVLCLLLLLLLQMSNVASPVASFRNGGGSKVGLLLLLEDDSDENNTTTAASAATTTQGADGTTTLNVNSDFQEIVGLEGELLVTYHPSTTRLDTQNPGYLNIYRKTPDGTSWVEQQTELRMEGDRRMTDNVAVDKEGTIAALAIRHWPGLSSDWTVHIFESNDKGTEWSERAVVRYNRCLSFQSWISPLFLFQFFLAPLLNSQCNLSIICGVAITDVALEGNMLAVLVSTKKDCLTYGAVVIFRRSLLGTWYEEATFSVANEFDLFPLYLVLSGDTLAVRVYDNDVEEDFVQVFERSLSGQWNQQAKVYADNSDVAIDGDTLAIALSSGEVGIWMRQTSSWIFTTWTRQATLPTTCEPCQGFYGFTRVAVRGDFVAFAQEGIGYVYKRSGETWSEHVQIPLVSPENSTTYGTQLSAALDDNTVAFGVDKDDAAMNEIIFYDL